MVADDHGDPFADGNGNDRFYPRHAAREMVKVHEKETDITIDTSELTPDEAAQEILLYLEEQGYVR